MPLHLERGLREVGHRMAEQREDLGTRQLVLLLQVQQKFVQGLYLLSAYKLHPSRPMMSETSKKSRRELRAASATAGSYWLPTRPYTLCDAMNRAAAATGSVRYAQQAANSGYNGHAVSVTYNDYHDYCICEHYWGERVVHARGSMETALRAGRAEYDLGHRGTRVITCALTPGESQAALALGYIPWSMEGEEAWNALWFTELHSCVGEALGDARHGCDTVHLLMQASNRVDYQERKARAHADQIFGGRSVVSSVPRASSGWCSAAIVEARGHGQWSWSMATQSSAARSRRRGSGGGTRSQRGGRGQ